MFGRRLSEYVKELEEWLAMTTYDYEITKIEKLKDNSYKFRVTEYTPSGERDCSYNYDLFVYPSGSIKNEDGCSVLDVEENYNADDTEMLEFIKSFKEKWIGEDVRNLDIADRKVTRREFMKIYNRELEIMDNDDDGVDKAKIYGYPITIHWNGIYCDCGDGATPYNNIISNIESCDSELDNEDDIETEKENEEMENKLDEQTKVGFMVALKKLDQAFIDLSYYAGHVDVDDELWDGNNNYPFSLSFDEMPLAVEEWVDAVIENISPKKRIVYETNYSETSDRTFIMKCTYKGKEMIREECVGFYSGEPDDNNTLYFSNGKLVATYE